MKDTLNRASKAHWAVCQRKLLVWAKIWGEVITKSLMTWIEMALLKDIQIKSSKLGLLSPLQITKSRLWNRRTLKTRMCLMSLMSTLSIVKQKKKRLALLACKCLYPCLRNKSQISMRALVARTFKIFSPAQVHLTGLNCVNNKAETIRTLPLIRLKLCKSHQVHMTTKIISISSL